VRALVPEAAQDAKGLRREKDPNGKASEDKAGDDKPAARSNRVVTFHDTDQLGTYRVRAFRSNGVWVDRPDEAFIVNLDMRESDPTVLAADRRPDRRSGGGAEGGLPPLRRVELWHILGAALIAALLLESMLTTRLRREPIAAPGPTPSHGPSTV
jgi:hypothetical protein